MMDQKQSSINALAKHAQRLRSMSLRDIVNTVGRTDQFCISSGNLYFDFSKHFIDDLALDALLSFTRECGFEALRRAYLSGEKINVTEGRAVLHTALRRPRDHVVHVDGKDVMPAVHRILDRITAFSDGVLGGDIVGSTGATFTDVVNIGIGGSDLGPAMAYKALWPYHNPKIKVHYVSNIDGMALSQTLRNLSPETTLFVVASKTFTTQETLTNARSARDWLVSAMGTEESVGHHFVAVSTNERAVCEFGIWPERMFEFWDWVGGRFSVWSSVGLSLMLGIGSTNFRSFLDGGFEMDRHFEQAPLKHNAPFLMALLGFWYGLSFDATAHAILPYDEGLGRLPAFLQQGEMESNGKSVNRFGEPVVQGTCPVIFGEAGTNGQHAFYQLIHQGTHFIPVDFILPLQPHHQLNHHHKILASHCFAQAEALMVGRDLATVKVELESTNLDQERVDALAPHRVFKGNRPSTTILMDRLTPFALGQLIAAYEHKIFSQGVLWDIYSYDQWGVELGKVLAKQILPTLDSDASLDNFDASTRNLIERFRALGK